MTPALAASTLLILFTLGYVAVCAAQPFAACRKCRGFGFKVKTTRRGKAKRGKDCRRCHGHGARIRRGRHLWNLWRNVHRDGTR
ncbi:hypothetical protein QMK19_15080 [Streptomyces sp. H10-C2]|uniref:hypothetical protein n=1 Tax=unclassified Streptomyces TaxID=2593676 RepID=UPI0024B8949A|nr:MULTISPECIES: hypothetical protein [unclassified Streptomyces]MDJ0341377.1 hypothetical protein [Streptomyces sp. PH10-H1]MDJ0370972.1 hypothetical protein [Streptomyces sp. H10-C2]